MRRALVTGGASGLGAACVERLRNDGLDVVAADLDPRADLVLDVTDGDAVAREIDAAGPFDVLITSAGIVGPNAPVAEIGVDDFRRVLDVNLTGTFLCCRAVVPGMVARGWGRIVTVASMAGKDGNPRMSPYSASKAAVIGLTKSLGKELATTGVLVNAVAPAVIDTPMNSATSPEALEYMTSLIPMRRLGRASEVAALVSWLASDELSFSTGAVYDISGGRATY